MKIGREEITTTMLIEPKDLRRILRRFPKSTPRQQLFMAYAELISKHFLSCQIFPAHTTNSVYVSLPGSDHLIRISDHQKVKADVPTHVFPERCSGAVQLADRLDRAIRAAYSGGGREVLTWDRLHLPLREAI